MHKNIREELIEMNEIITYITLAFVFVLCAGVAFCIGPLESILRRKDKKNNERKSEK